MRVLGAFSTPWSVVSTQRDIMVPLSNPTWTGYAMHSEHYICSRHKCQESSMGRQRWMMVGKKHLIDYHAPCVQNSLCNSKQISHRYATQITIQHRNDENSKHQFGLGIYTKALLVLLQDVDKAIRTYCSYSINKCHRQRANQLSKDV